mmetsp:Transcript_3639/g.6195  ORF Transcript_3639/g.6195 Transcript_3639/m.6195 type:complete len:247 (-) Transcript_3639:1408-2148(-)
MLSVLQVQDQRNSYHCSGARGVCGFEWGLEGPAQDSGYRRRLHPRELRHGADRQHRAGVERGGARDGPAAGAGGGPALRDQLRGGRGRGAARGAPAAGGPPPGGGAVARGGGAAAQARGGRAAQLRGALPVHGALPGAGEGGPRAGRGGGGGRRRAGPRPGRPCSVAMDPARRPCTGGGGGGGPFARGGGAGPRPGPGPFPSTRTRAHAYTGCDGAPPPRTADFLVWGQEGGRRGPPERGVLQQPH